MPNWCANVVKISHNDSVMMDRMIESFQKGKLLQEFIPCPKSLLKTVAGKLSDKRKQRRLERTEKRNKQRYGFTNWYDWRLANWGTKWDIEGIYLEDNGDGTISLSFDSAWSPPVEAYNTLYDMGFDIKAYYYEPGVGFAGIWEDGDDSSYDVLSPDDAELLPPELDEMFAISEMFAEYEEESEE
jgi:hypothetical protein